MNLLKNCKMIVVEVTTAAGTSAITTDIVDTKGFSGVMFLIPTGDVLDTAVIAAKLQQDTAAAMGGAADLTGTITFTADATSGDSKLLVLDLSHPHERYIRAVITRTVANSAIGAIIALLYDPHNVPTTQDATVIASALLVSPSES